MNGSSMILVPLDGSKIAEHALGLAAMIARRSGARLHIAKAMEPLSVLATGEEPMAGPELDQELRELSRSYLQLGRRSFGYNPWPGGRLQRSRRATGCRPGPVCHRS